MISFLKTHTHGDKEREGGRERTKEERRGGERERLIKLLSPPTWANVIPEATGCQCQGWGTSPNTVGQRGPRDPKTIQVLAIALAAHSPFWFDLRPTPPEGLRSWLASSQDPEVILG